MRRLIEFFLFPSFLRRFDEKLLIERPSLWATRLHRVAWPAFLLALLTTCLGLLAPIDKPYQIDIFLGAGIWGILFVQAGLVIYWFYNKKDQYHVEREQGMRRQSAWVEFGSYTAALFLIGFSSLTFFVSTQNRVRSISDQQFAHDLFLVHVASVRTYKTHQKYQDLDTHYHSSDHDQEHYRAYLQQSAALFASSEEKETILNNFFTDTPYPSEYNYLLEHLDMADLAPLQAQWANGDYSALFSLWSTYTNRPVDDVADAWDEWRTASTQYGRFNQRYMFGADYKIDTVFNLSFSPHITLLTALVWFVVMLPIAFHLSLIRFTLKYAGWKGMLLCGVVGAVGGFAAICAAFIYLFIGSPAEYVVVFVVCLIGLAVTLLTFFYLRTILERTQFKWIPLLLLTLFPLFVAAAPYLATTMIGIIVEAFGELPDIPQGIDLLRLYIYQFAYIPFLGWLKRRHMHLLSLPRN